MPSIACIDKSSGVPWKLTAGENLTRLLLSSTRAALLLTALIFCQLVPSVEYCHVPCVAVAVLDDTAIPAMDAVPSASLYCAANKSSIAIGLVVSSGCGAMMASLITGASLTALTDSSSNAAELKEVPPLIVSAKTGVLVVKPPL